MDNDNTFYMHSRCCNAHWELTYTVGGSYDLVCERCKKQVGSGVLVTGPDLGTPKCAQCESGDTTHKH